MFGRPSPKREDVARALDRVRLADGRGLAESGLLQGLVVAEGRVRFIIEAPGADAADGERLRAEAEAAARSVKGVTAVTAVLTAEAPRRAAPSATSSPPSSAPAAEARRVRRGARLSDEAMAQTAPPPGASGAGLAIDGVRHVIAVASAKGGVGKSTLAVNLACALADLGLKVGLLDCDVYGPSVPTLTGLVDAEPATRPDRKLEPLSAFGLKIMSIGFMVDADAPMIWRGPIVMSAINQMTRDVAWAPLDVLVLDTPPGTGDAQLALAQRLSLSGAVIVSTPQEMALADVRRGIAMFRKTHVPILGVIENMSYLALPDGTRMHPFGEGGARRTAEALGVPFLGALPLDPALRASADAGAPLVATRMGGDTGAIFADMATAIAARLAGGADERPAPVIRLTDD
jgi:ATP-binding protein involved in chromosome partitioning